MSQNKNPSVSFPSSTLIIFFTNIAWWWYVFWLALKLLDYLLSFAFKPNNLSLVFFINSSLTVCVKGVCILFYFSNKKKMDGFWFGDGAYRSCTSSIFHFNSFIRRYYLIILRSCIDECEFRSERSYRHRSVLLAAF